MFLKRKASWCVQIITHLCNSLKTLPANDKHRGGQTEVQKTDERGVSSTLLGLPKEMCVTFKETGC